MDLHIILLLSKNVSYTFSPKPRSDVSRFLLIKDLLQFDSHKRPPLISENQLFAFWVVSYGWFDCIISHKNENTNLRLYVTQDDSQRQFLAQHSVAMRHCFKWLQHCFNNAKLCYTKNHHCGSFYVSMQLHL